MKNLTKIFLPPLFLTPLFSQEASLERIQTTSEAGNESKVEKERSSSKVTGKELIKYTIKTTEQLGRIFPNLHIYSRGADTFPMISYRGVSSPDYYSSILGLYVDGIPQSPSFLIQTLGDVENIELINGSEGLLYGENAPLGIISITSKNPMKKPYALASLQGSRLQQGINLQMGRELIKDKLWGKGNFRYIYDNGFIKDPVTKKMLNPGQSLIAGTSLYYQPIESLLLNANYSYYHTFTRKDFFFTQSQIKSLTLPNNQGITWQEFSDGVQDRILNKTPFMNLDAQNASLKMEYFTKSSTLSVVGAYQKVDTLANEYPGIYVQNEKKDGYYYNNVQFIGEARLHTTYKGGQETLFGIYYKNLLTDNGMVNVPTEPIGYSGNWDAAERLNTFAIFGNASFPFGAFSLHAGVRYQLFHNRIVSKNPPVTDIAPYTNAKTFNTVNPRLSLFWHFSKQSSFYLQLSTSTKPGGFAKFPFADTDTIPYGSENIYSAELGNKTHALSNRLQVKTAFYGIFRTDTQAYAGNGYYKSIKNIGNAYAYGVDFTLKYQGDYFDLFTSFNLGESRFAKGGKNIGTITILGVTGHYNISGLRPKFSPLFSLNTGTDIYFFKIPNHNLKLTSLLHFSTGYYIKDFTRSSALYQKPFVLLELSLIYNFRKRYTFMIFGQNLTNARYITHAIHNAKGNAYSIGNPINFGGKVIYRY
ncbi:TonB-dependent receptor [Helicobacter mustelae]|uniref:TonB-dependent receptor n=1 Tax=Helicobacter mustelae TaxID=217 RepID=UPI000E073259|nr:TonB-dependent receptor plug domain-containing protein [Helicobacter mustelae]STP13294.1 TonB-dependent receptor [Helicobacter mustelae]